MEMTDRDLLELIAAKVGGLETRFDRLEEKVDKIDNVVKNIEVTHGEKLKALFDGYQQHTDILKRIEDEVSRQEEVILRKVK